jgi:hypothetical protein
MLQWREFPLYDGFNSLAIRAENRGMIWPEWNRERLIVSFAGISSTSPLQILTDTGTSSGFSETADCVGSLSHFRNDFDYWNFLYLKSALILIATLPMQACRNQECRT